MHGDGNRHCCRDSDFLRLLPRASSTRRESTALHLPVKTPGTQLVFVPNDTAAEVDGRAKAEEGSEDTTSIDGEATSTQST
ncbi:hypothetical protein MRX96_026674 [Rhipicephalus microplus]